MNAGSSSSKSLVRPQKAINALSCDSPTEKQLINGLADLFEYIGKCETHYTDKLQLRKDLEEKSAEVIKLKLLNAQLQTKVLGYELYLGGPVGIESQEVDCFLNWLKNTENLSRCQRWLVAVSFKLTAKAAVIREYLDTKSVAATTFTQELDHLYSGCSRVIHLERPYPPPESDEERWEEIFDNLQMYSIATQDTFKAIVLHFDVPNACAVNFPEIIKNDEEAKAKGGYLLIKNINLNVDVNSVVEYFKNKKVIVYDSLNLLDSKTQKNARTFLLRVGDLKVAKQLAYELPEEMKKSHSHTIVEAHGFNEV